MNDEGSVQTTSSTHQPDDAIAAYALGVLDPEERERLEAHLAGCPVCRAELARQEAVVGELGFSATPVAPRAELRESLLSEIRPRAETAAAPQPIRRFPVAWLGIAAAVMLVAIAALSLILVRTMNERDDAVHAEREIAEYLSGGGTLSPLVPAPGAPADVATGHGTLAIAPDQEKAMLVIHDLPPSGDGHTYMAWAERDGERVRLGELTVNDEGVGWLLLSAPNPMSTYETVGINRFTPDAPDGEPFLVATVR